MFVISAARGELAETGLGMYSFQELYMPKPLSAKRLLCGSQQWANNEQTIGMNDECFPSGGWISVKVVIVMAELLFIHFSQRGHSLVAFLDFRSINPPSF